MSAPGKTAVPKFSSFRPRPAPPEEKTAPPATTASAAAAHPSHRPTKRRRNLSPDQRRPSRSRHSPRLRDATRHAELDTRSGRDRSDGRHDASHHSLRREDRRSSNHVHIRQPSNELFVPDEKNELFARDLRGDPQNLAYGRLHRYSIPAYRRYGHGCILGLRRDQRIHLDGSTEHNIMVLDSQKLNKARPERELLKRQKHRLLPELHVTPHTDLETSDEFEDFISLRLGNRGVPSGDASEDHEDDSEDYRDIGSVPTAPARPTDPDLHYVQSDGGTFSSSDADVQARQRNAELFRLTKQDPTTLSSWLDLINHQKHLVHPGLSSTDLSNIERRTLADMRISIYEKALKNVPASLGTAHEQLLQGMLEEASIVWDTQKYLQRSEEILREHSASFALWTKYLDAAQTNPINFRFEDGKSFFLKCLQNLKDPSSSSSSKSGNAGGGQDVQLYILLRYTTFLREAGYEELAIATWQGLIEFHLFRPHDLPETSESATLAAFEQFWESEAPRFGEKDARGWRGHEDEDEIVPLSKPDSGDIVLAKDHPFQSFASLEQTSMEECQFPGKTMEEVGSDDPFHLIFYSDIKDVLEATGLDLPHRTLIDAFLISMGLPELQNASTSTNYDIRTPQWRSDVFLVDGLLGGHSSATEENSLGGHHLTRYRMTTDSLFSEAFVKLQTWIQDGSSPALNLARQCLSMLVEAFPTDDVLAEYHLAFELRYFPETSLKAAKDVLKKQPSSLRLYNACAMIEARLGHSAKAEKIWTGALKMKNSLPAKSQFHSILLIRSWVWNELRQGNRERALSLLLSYESVDIGASSTTDVTSSVALLRVTRILKDGFDHALSQSQAQLLSLNSECLALLSYATKSDGVQAAVNVIHEHCALVSKTEPPNNLALELLHQAKAGILAYHIHQRHPYKPAFIRSELEASIIAFPNNTIFLDLYRENEQRFRIDDRVRSILKDEVIAKGRSPMIGWSFAIDQEISRYISQASGSTAESVRSTFTRALLSTGSVVRHSKTLWTKWFEFEKHALAKPVAVGNGQGKRDGQHASKKLRDVFLNGLHHLPWAKGWILQGLQTFDDQDSYKWGTSELKSLFNVLIERELRIRVEGLEDLLDEIAESK